MRVKFYVICCNELAITVILCQLLYLFGNSLMLPINVLNFIGTYVFHTFHHTFAQLSQWCLKLYSLWNRFVKVHLMTHAKITTTKPLSYPVTKCKTAAASQTSQSFANYASPSMKYRLPDLIPVPCKKKLSIDC